MISKKELKKMLIHAKERKYAITQEDRTFWNKQIEKIENSLGHHNRTTQRRNTKKCQNAFLDI